MTPLRFIANMNAVQQEFARMHPDVLKAIEDLIATVERQDSEIRALNKRLASLSKKK